MNELFHTAVHSARVLKELQAQAESTRGIAESAHQLLEQARAHQLFVDEFVRPQQQLKKFFEELMREDEEFSHLADRARELGRLGWTLPLWVPPNVIRDFLQDADRASVHKELVRYFSASRGRNANELISTVCAEARLRRWSRLLRQAAAAFRRRQYAIVVPALFAVLDGRIAHATGAQRTKRPARQSALSGRRTAQSGLAVAAWASIEGFVEVTFETHPFSSPPPQSLNRHWALHGRSEPHWSRVDCLRLWQAIHTISDAVSDGRAAT